MMAGLGALTFWNSLLNSFGFYESMYDFNVNLYFPIPLFIATNIFSVLMIFLKNKISIKTRITFTIFG